MVESTNPCPSAFPNASAAMFCQRILPPVAAAMAIWVVKPDARYAAVEETNRPASLANADGVRDMT
jgi:hypothetical protein